MSDSQMEWVKVHDYKQREIGAIGFLNGKAVAVAAFYDDADGNMDGKVSWGEKLISTVFPLLGGKAVVEVAMTARVDMEILQRDASFYQVANQLYLEFAAGLVAEGIYIVYFSRGVKAVGKGAATLITDSLVKQLVIRKGFEQAVKEVFDAAVKP
ncbi:MAG: hypothetical protein VX874_06330 [Pseudomonadota bacterium]|nr:hypothetical protein [Pseudomonadota bacterium]